MTRVALAVAIALLCAPAPSLVRAEDLAAPARPRDAAAMTPADIAACMSANVVERGSLREIRVEATDALGGARKMRMKLFWKPSRDGREERMTLRVLEPRDVAGTAYLVVSRPDGEDVYTYLPGVGRVQRLVVGDARTRTLLGTDFTYAEIRQVQGLLQRGETRRVADARVFDRPAFVLQTATALEETGYRRVDSYVDQATCTRSRPSFAPRESRRARCSRRISRPWSRWSPTGSCSATGCAISWREPPRAST